MNYLFEIPLLILIGITLKDLFVGQKNPGIEEKFSRKEDNQLYNISFLAPFRWFITNDERNKDALKIEKQIQAAGLSGRYNYRSIMTYQVLFTFAGIIGALLLVAFSKPILFVIALGFNLSFENFVTDENVRTLRLVLLIGGLAPSFIAKRYLLKQSKKDQIDFIKDLPLLQTYIISMLESGATINVVFRVLSVTKTTYQSIFQKAYRIWLRDPVAGFSFLENQFEGTLILDTIEILKHFDEFDREETIRTLENNRDQIVEYSKGARRKAETGVNIMNQLSVVFPFASVILLAIGPVFYWAVKLFKETGLF